MRHFGRQSKVEIGAHQANTPKFMQSFSGVQLLYRLPSAANPATFIVFSAARTVNQFALVFREIP
jgi:hypothetical protein